MQKLFHNLPEQERQFVASLEARSKARADGKFDHTKLTFGEWKGYRYPPSANAETAMRAYSNVNFDDDVVLLAAFPKTGTHWFMEILKQMLYYHDEKLADACAVYTPTMYYLEMGSPQKLDLWKYLVFPRKIYATHLPEEMVNVKALKERKGKIIVLLRNPKDQAVSWFHFAKSNPNFDAIRDEMSEDWNQFILDYMSGKHRICTRLGEWYPEFLLQWYKYKDDPDVKFVYYEDMKKDPIGEVKNLASFLHVDLTEERVAEIAAATSFDVMKGKQEQKATVYAKLQSRAQVIRKGQVGAWKETFTVRQSEIMDKIIAEKLGETDIQFTYE